MEKQHRNSSEMEMQPITLGTLDRDSKMLNQCFDDIERFVAKLKQIAVEHRSSLNTRFEIPPYFPTEQEFSVIFHKFKSCFNILANLKDFIHDPNASELLHFIFVPFTIILDACERGVRKHVAEKVYDPPLTHEAHDFLFHQLNSNEFDVWNALGDAWRPPVEHLHVEESEPVVRRTILPPTKESEPVVRRTILPPPKVEQFKPRTSRMARVNKSRFGRNPKELTVTEGEFIEVVNDDKNWWLCKTSDGKEGFVPYTNLNVVAEDTVTRTTVSPTLASNKTASPTILIPEDPPSSSRLANSTLLDESYEDEEDEKKIRKFKQQGAFKYF